MQPAGIHNAYMYYYRSQRFSLTKYVGKQQGLKPEKNE